MNQVVFEGDGDSVQGGPRTRRSAARIRGPRFALGALAAAYAIVEVALASFYRRSANSLAASVFEALVAGWLLAAVLPIGW